MTNSERRVITNEDVLSRVEECRKLAAAKGIAADFENKWDYLQNMGTTFFGRPSRVRVTCDFAPHSFYFVIDTERKDKSGWDFAMNGGLIWHENSNEWSIHT